jgi:hypothetical protein
VNVPGLDDVDDLPRVAYVAERVGAEDDEVGDFAHGDRAV